MITNKWLKIHTRSLSGKTVAITGSTGGLGQALCHHLSALGASLILLDRNAERSHALQATLAARYGVHVQCIGVDMEDLATVRQAIELLLREPPDILICNAGAYSIPRKTCDSGYGNVFQINFIAPYCMIRALLPALSARGGKVIAVGSIAHNYAKSDPDDVDFSKREASSLVYGNAKRHLMFALYRLFEREQSASLSIVHPGISFTGITAHYPPLLFALIKHPMKLIFMKPRRAALAILQGCFECTPTAMWIGPRLFDVWGVPRKKRLRSFESKEADRIAHTAEEIAKRLGFSL